jgi:DnaJ-class molecular chaperone
MSRHHRLCEKCRRTFAWEKEDQKLCNLCEKETYIREKSLEMPFGKVQVCPRCKEEYKDISGTRPRKYCSEVCAGRHKPRYSSKPVKDKSKINKAWQEDRLHKPSKPLPYYVLNIIAEKKRLETMD